MKKLLLTSLFSLAVLLSPQFALASGSGLTTSTQGTGQVIVTTEDGTMYLTTQVIPEETSANPQYVSFFGSDIIVPTGFAENIGDYINALLTFVFLIAALTVFLFLIWGGFSWITSGGDKGKVENARNRMFAAVLGIIILAASYAILIVVLRFLGFTDLNDVFDNVQTISQQTQIIRVQEATNSAIIK